MRTKNIFLSVASIIACFIMLTVACEKTPVTPVETNISDSTDISSTSLDFGDAQTSLPLEINVPNATDRWNIRRSRSSNWLSVDVEDGSGSKQLTVSIDRSKLPAGISRDTLIIRGLRRPGLVASKNTSEVQADTAKMIAVSVNNSGAAQAKAQNALQVLQQQLSTLLSGMTLPTRLDTTISFVGTFALAQGSGSPTFSSMGAFVVGNSILASVGSSVQLVGRTGGTPISLAQRGLSYTSSRTGTTVSGFVYAPSALVIVPRNITFDGTAAHTFTVPASSAYAGFTDNVISAAMPSFTSTPSTVSISQNLTLGWQPTSAADDSVFVVLTLASDSIPRAAPTIASDDAGSVTISAAVLNALLGGRTGSATLSIVRYRNKIVRGTPNRGLLSEAQRSYPVTVTP
jgi:hypothetical protein